MKTPKKKEVVKYFENAKEIKSHTGQIFELKRKITKENNFFRSGCFVVWAPIHGYAKILSYKEPKEKTYKITREQIKEIYGYCNSTELQNTVKEWFPSAFKEEKKELPKDFTGWVKTFNLIDADWLMYFYKGIQKYGFCSGDAEWWQSNTDNQRLGGDEIEATNQEVEEALIKEAVKRGFVIGNYFRPTNCETIVEIKQDRTAYNEEENKLIVNNFCAFHNGTWATIIPTISKQEAEEKLNCKIV